jgi:hypothetical protein
MCHTTVTTCGDGTRSACVSQVAPPPGTPSMSATKRARSSSSNGSQPNQNLLYHMTYPGTPDTHAAYMLGEVFMH